MGSKVINFSARNRASKYLLNTFGALARGLYKKYVPGRTRSCYKIANTLSGSTSVKIQANGIFAQNQKLSSNPFLIEAFLNQGIIGFQTNRSISGRELASFSKGKVADSSEINILRDKHESSKLLSKVQPKTLSKLATTQARTALVTGLLYCTFKIAAFAASLGIMDAADIVISSLFSLAVFHGVFINSLKQQNIIDAQGYESPKLSKEVKEQVRGVKGPKVTIIIPARNEPINMLEKTLLAASRVNYKNAEVVLLLDSPPGSPNAEEAEKLVERLVATSQNEAHLPIKIFSRKKYSNVHNQIQNKADNINAFLKYALGKTLVEAKDSQGKLYLLDPLELNGRKDLLAKRTFSFQDSKHVAIADADYELSAEFLQETVPHMESNENNAYIMTPQNLFAENPNAVEDINTLLTHAGWQLFNKGVAKRGQVLFGGTNSLVRVAALKSVSQERDDGGIDFLPTDSVTEDLALSLKFIEKGYDSEFVPYPLARGKPISSMGDHFSTYWRYTEGSLKETFKQTLPFMFKDKSFALSLEGLEFFNKGVLSLYGFPLAFFSLMPALSLLGVQLPIASPLPFLFYVLTLSNIARTSTTQITGNGLTKHLKLGIFMFLHFPVYIHGSLAAIKNWALGKRASFATTIKDGTRSRIPLKYLFPLLGFLGINVFAAGESLTEFFSTGYSYLLENFGWASLQAGMLSYGLAKFNGTKNTCKDLYYGTKDLLSKSSTS